MIEIRDAKCSDALGISEVFHSCYGDDYTYPQFYDPEGIAKMIYSDDTLLLVAEDTETKEILGTASVLHNAGSNSDLVGEFGRLAVRPSARKRGVGRRLMEERLERVKAHLQVGIVEARCIHPFSLKISEKQGFSAVGFLPMKMVFAYRESITVLIQHFGDALKLRHNHPRIIPEIYPLAHVAMENCGIPCDVIVDEESAPYPYDDDYQIEEFGTEGYSSLLRIQRGRVKNREIFGPLRLHYGFLKLSTKKSNYLVAKRHGQIVGAVGFIHDEFDKVARIFEVISLDDHVLRFLLAEFERRCREEFKVEYLEVDVSAYSPRMQRTLLELDFVPCAYMPAYVFHEVERLDTVKMVKLFVPFAPQGLQLTSKPKHIFDIVSRSFEKHRVGPVLEKLLQEMSLFEGLNREQVRRLAGLCQYEEFEDAHVLYREDEAADKMYLILEGEVSVSLNSSENIGTVSAGESIGEIALLTGDLHSATITSRGPLKTASLSHEEIAVLVRRRPDIGVQIYKNVAAGLGKKLKRSDEVLKSKSSSIRI